ncbi:hypothetical protein COV21_00635, partial [Candidatus Woesearchaeota archaeon CG10_big_fil_rev_8_21_14_0_10_45_5]
MIDIKDFAEMKKKLEEFDEQRESLVSEVRNIVRLSKRIIYSVHRNDEKSSDESVAEIRKIVKATMQKVRKEPALLHSGLLKSAIQEYVEAVCFY